MWLKKAFIANGDLDLQSAITVLKLSVQINSSANSYQNPY